MLFAVPPSSSRQLTCIFSLASRPLVAKLKIQPLPLLMLACVSLWAAANCLFFIGRLVFYALISCYTDIGMGIGDYRKYFYQEI